jgi:putative ABC transport system substrate-binding protein
LAALALPAFAQQRSSIPVVGVLSGRSRAAAIDTGIQADFVQGMKELGWVEGRNIRYEWRFAAGGYSDLRRLADELVRLKVDVIVAEGTSAVGPARQATSTIPIVMATSSDPVGSGFVASLARPGGNVTGLTSIAVEATRKRLELLVTTIPGLSRLAALANPNNRGSKAFLREVESAAKRFNLRVVPLQASTTDEITAAFQLMNREKVQAVILPTDAFFITQRGQIVDLAAKARLPVIYPTREFFVSGGLMVYGLNVAHMYRRSATYVHKILKGARPSELPVEQPDALELLVNLKTAQQLGVTIPLTVLMRANEVIR